MDDVYAIVLAGGRGTRFWPLSRRSLPKQCLSLDGGPTLIQRTISRTGLPPERVLVVTGPDMADAVRAQVPEGVECLVEPSGRNTAPAIVWAVAEVARRGGRRCAVLPSDHWIADEAAFRAALAEGLRAAESGALVTLGVRPTRPETGFGWIEPAEEDGGVGLPVRRFVEKPPRTVAEELLAGGRHLWNAGMFVWRTDALLDAAERHLGAPGAVEALRSGAPVERVWGDLPATSIDYGVMERAGGIRVIGLDCGWSDVGSWPALAEVLPAGEGGVVVADAQLARDASGNVVWAPGRLVAMAGVSDLVVVATPDVLLVARRDDVQGVKMLLEEVESRGLGRYA